MAKEIINNKANCVYVGDSALDNIISQRAKANGIDKSTYYRNVILKRYLDENPLQDYEQKMYESYS